MVAGAKQKNQYLDMVEGFNIKEDEKEEDDDEDDDDAEPDYNFKDKVDLAEVRTLIMKTHIGIPFNTNILRIAINKHEEMIAQTLVYSYEINI